MSERKKWQKFVKTRMRKEEDDRERKKFHEADVTAKKPFVSHNKYTFAI